MNGKENEEPFYIKHRDGNVKVTGKSMSKTPQSLRDSFSSRNGHPFVTL